mgnify:CR=1 FL=1
MGSNLLIILRWRGEAPRQLRADASGRRRRRWKRRRRRRAKGKEAECLRFVPAAEAAGGRKRAKENEASKEQRKITTFMSCELD